MTTPTHQRARAVVDGYVNYCNSIGSHSRIYSTYLQDAIAAALQAETEACAKVAETSDYGCALNMDYQDGFDQAKEQLAAAIRQRKGAR